MFKKLNLSFPVIDYSGGDLVVSYGRFPSLKYYSVFNDINLSTFKYKPKVRYCEITGIGLLQPHIDHGITCCVNYYIQSNSCTTTFYKKLQSSTASVCYGKTTANLYNIEELVELGSFNANDGDCYLLNVSEIHSVTIPKTGVRKFLTFNWFDRSYEEIKESLTFN